MGMSKTGVEYILKTRGVSRLPRNRRGRENSSVKALMAKPDCPSAKVRNTALMTEMYIDKRMTTTEIGRELGVDHSTVLTGLRFCGIPVRTISEANRGRSCPSMKGALNPAWNGGSTSWRKLAREGLNACFIRPVMERDGFACRWCGSKKKLVVHHDRRSFMDIVRLVQQNNPDEPKSELVRAIIDEHELEDGTTLCKPCHDKHHKENGK